MIPLYTEDMDADSISMFSSCIVIFEGLDGASQERAYKIVKKRRFYGAFPMDLAGIEPASESPSTRASPITVIILTFPPSVT